jgi:hypothetical protein
MTLLNQAPQFHHPGHGSLWETVTSALSRKAGHWPASSVTILRALLILGGALLVLAAVRWWLRSQTRRQPGLTYEIVPRDGSQWEPAAWITFYRALYGMSSPWWTRVAFGQPWVALEFIAAGGRVPARCWFRPRLEAMLRAQLMTALPGLDFVPVTDEPPLTQPAARSRLHMWREELYPLGQPKADALRGILGALSVAQSGVVQLVMRPDVGWQGRARKRLDRLAGISGSHGLLSGVLWDLFDIFLGRLFAQPHSAVGNHPPSRTGPEPPSGKADQPGYQVEIRLRVSSRSSGEAKQVMHSVVSAFRALDGANGLRPARVWLHRRFDTDLVRRHPPRTSGLTLIPEELASLFHLPCAGVAMDVAPVRASPARLSQPSPGDKVICLLEDDRQTPVTIAQADARQHIHILGPTGSGKSTLLLNLALDDIRAGRGVGVVDPKGDLVRALLERIPREDADRVVLIDPSYRDRPVGLNVLECPDVDLREVVGDSIVTIFKKTYERFWGPRTDDILRAAVLTLLNRPDTTLCEVPLLLLRPEARKQYLEGLDDPVGLEPFWEEYEQTPGGQRLQMVGPLLNKLRSVLLRRTVRNMLGQAQSTVNIANAMDQQGILLVSLAKGLLGEETSRLLGSFLVARIWHAALARADRPEPWRPDFNLYLDEFQNYLHLPQSLDEVLVEARGYHLGLTLANQHLAQLGASTRQALAANARTRVVFQCGQEDARYLAREFDPILMERDLRNLQRFQVALRLCVNGHTAPPFTGVTQPMSESLGESHAAWILNTVLARCGRPRALVEQEIEARCNAYRPEPAARAK